MINVINQVVDTEDSAQLVAPCQIEEFKETMFSKQPDKCPGPDGFNL